MIYCLYLFFNDTATTEIYTLSLHDALPISPEHLLTAMPLLANAHKGRFPVRLGAATHKLLRRDGHEWRSEEHTSELQSQSNLVCRLLLEKKSTGRLQPLRGTTGPRYSARLW